MFASTSAGVMRGAVRPLALISCSMALSSAQMHEIRVEGDRVSAGFDAEGCGAAIAAGSAGFCAISGRSTTGWKILGPPIGVTAPSTNPSSSAARIPARRRLR